MVVALTPSVQRREVVLVAAWGRPRQPVQDSTGSLGRCADALALGGGEEPARGQELVAVSGGESQRARRCDAGRAHSLRAPVSVGGCLLWRRQLLQLQPVHPLLLLVVSGGQVQQAEDVPLGRQGAGGAPEELHGPWRVLGCALPEHLEVVDSLHLLIDGGHLQLV